MSRREFNTPWKRTEKDRAYQRRKAAADARAAAHVYDPATCKPGCLAFRVPSMGSPTRSSALARAGLVVEPIEGPRERVSESGAP